MSVSATTDWETPAPVLQAPTAVRLAVLRTFPEESWPSMDLCWGMFDQHLRRDHAASVRPVELWPPFRARLQRLPWIGRRRAALNADRLINRLWDYPRHIRRRTEQADCFHIVDHSYAQLVHELPADRTGVYCHDLDTFRCLLAPAREPRPRWFRAMTRRILTGLARAGVVFHSTHAVREAIERHGLVDPERLVHVPLGFAPEFCSADATEDQLTEPSLCDVPYVLHVGSCIPRKRIDVLIELFAQLRERLPALRLVKVGGEWTAEQRTMLTGSAVADAVVHLVGIERRQLAALYRRARLVLMPSEAEGFGLPVLEALACGAVVLASDLPALREVGGLAACYAPVGDVPAWTDAALQLLRDPQRVGPAAQRALWAQRFSWQRHTRTMVDTYLGLLQRAGVRRCGGIPSVADTDEPALQSSLIVQPGFIGLST